MTSSDYRKHTIAPNLSCIDTMFVVWQRQLFLCVGKSTLLDVLGNREVPIPDQMDIFHLTEEMAASDKTPLQCVMEVDEERWGRVRFYILPYHIPPFHRVRLESEAEQLMKASGDMESERLQDIYERLDELDAANAETKAARLLHGLGESLTIQ